MSRDEIVQLMKRYFEEIWHNQNFDTAKEIIHKRFPASNGKSGPKALIKVVKKRHKNFPGFRFQYEIIVRRGVVGFLMYLQEHIRERNPHTKGSYLESKAWLFTKL